MWNHLYESKLKCTYFWCLDERYQPFDIISGSWITSKVEIRIYRITLFCTMIQNIDLSGFLQRNTQPLFKEKNCFSEQWQVFSMFSFFPKEPQKVYYPPVRSQHEIEELIKGDALPDDTWTLVNYKMLHRTSRWLCVSKERSANCLTSLIKTEEIISKDKKELIISVMWFVGNWGIFFGSDDYNMALTKMKKYERARDTDSPSHTMHDLAAVEQGDNRDAEFTVARKRKGEK